MKSPSNIVGGIAGLILRVNLTTREIKTERTDNYARRWTGGRAIASWILLNETSPDMVWSDPETPLIFSAGTLVGTLAPCACRVSIDTINAFNNGKGSANFGGHWGPELKFAGFDHVVITGKAASPVYLFIHDGQAQIRDALVLWGKTTDKTEEFIQTELGDSAIRVASIGPAGENLVKGSAIIGDTGFAAGGSGVGCVMGTKKLKAVAVRGSTSVKVADPSRFMKAIDAAYEKIENSPFINGKNEKWGSFRQGLMHQIHWAENPQVYAVRNGQDFYYSKEKSAKLVGKNEGAQKYYTKKWNCFACPIAALPFIEIREGRYKGMKGPTYWANAACYSMLMDSDDGAASANFMLLCNQLGLDGDTAAATTSWAFDCYEKGIITKEDLGGLELRWGDDDAWMKLTEMIAHRQFLGGLLAEGTYEASRRIGRRAGSLSVTVKKQDTIDNFFDPVWELGITTSPVGPRHLRGAPNHKSGPKELQVDVGSVEKAPELVYWQLRTKEIEDNLGLCAFVEWGGAHALWPADFVEFFNAATGLEFTEDSLMASGEASYNLEKAFNTIHAGFTREDDLPPKRLMNTVIKSGPRAGRTAAVDQERHDIMLDRFYELLGWDSSSGKQKKERLFRLGMEDVAEKLGLTGLL
jgi:aldehyde:ferredoxin oxidoreductase